MGGSPTGSRRTYQLPGSSEHLVDASYPDSMKTTAHDEVLAVIPTYQPTPALLDLLDALAPQVYSILVSDDASQCTFDGILRDADSKQKAAVLRHTRNSGVARGLNDGLRTARAANIPWLVTIDQDSRIGTNYVEDLVKAAHMRIAFDDRLGAIGAEIIRDAAGELTYPSSPGTRRPITEELIQTGTLWSVPALIEIGGFDESLGIDAVDAAACLRLRERGYSIAIAPGISVEHSIGSARMVPFLGRTVMVTGHSPTRRTSMLRNRLRLFPAEFRQSPTHAVRTIRRVVVNQSLGLVLDGQRREEALGSLRGLVPKRSGARS